MARRERYVTDTQLDDAGGWRETRGVSIIADK